MQGATGLTQMSNGKYMLNLACPSPKAYVEDPELQEKSIIGFKSLMLMGCLITVPFAWPWALGGEGIKDIACQKAC